MLYSTAFTKSFSPTYVNNLPVILPPVFYSQLTFILHPRVKKTHYEFYEFHSSISN
jgi:hypothetical protein